MMRSRAYIRIRLWKDIVVGEEKEFRAGRLRRSDAYWLQTAIGNYLGRFRAIGAVPIQMLPGLIFVLIIASRKMLITS